MWNLTGIRGIGFIGKLIGHHKIGFIGDLFGNIKIRLIGRLIGDIEIRLIPGLGQQSARPIRRLIGEFDSINNPRPIWDSINNLSGSLIREPVKHPGFGLV